MILLLALAAVQLDSNRPMDSFSECMWSRFRQEGANQTPADNFARIAASACASEERSFTSGLAATLMKDGKPPAAARSLARQVAAELRHNIVVVYRMYNGASDSIVR